MRTHQARPLLRWAGSKRQLLPVLSRYWSPGYERYVEPFAGSACLFFQLQPERAILGDINGELILTYKEVRDSVDLVIEALSRLEKGRAEYLRLRALDPAALSPPDRAARFIYLNRFCFNGLYRTNASGQFNVPYGGDRAGSLPSHDALRRYSHLLRGAQLTAGDFGQTLAHVRPGDFVYLDPPFVVRNRRIFNEYAAPQFGPVELRRLRHWMEALSERNIPFLVSYAESQEGGFLRDGFYTTTVTVKRNIAGFTTSRVTCNELLISNRHPDSGWEE